MAQRNELVRALGGHDAGDARRGEHVALGRLPRSSSASVSVSMATKPSAVAVRAVTGLSETSTMRAAPLSSMCDSLLTTVSGARIAPLSVARARAACASPRRRRPAASGSRRRERSRRRRCVSRAMSAGVKMPLSPTTMRSSGTRGASRSVVSSVVSKVLRLRLLMPMRRQSSASARSSSASSCTSAMASMPQSMAAAARSCAVASSTSARMMRMQSAPQARASAT